MALGFRDTQDNGIFSFFGDFGADNDGIPNMAPVVRRKKNKRHRKTSSNARRVVRHKRRNPKGPKKSKSGKRPYPTWLKKYWFKKKR